MAQWRDSGRAAAPGRELAIAAAVSLGITVLLALGVGLIWTLGRSASPSPGEVNSVPPTPTPRTIVIVQDPLVQEFDTARPSSGGASETDGLLPSGGPEPLATGGSGDGTQIDSGPLLDVPAKVPFAALAAGGWAGNDIVLSNPGTSAVAERWLTVGTVEASTLAIEAEMRVDHLLEAVCNQSFGLVVADRLTAQALGGGVVFPCDRQEPLARLSDVTAWQQGYFTTPVLAEQSFAPGSEWRTYRFELAGDRLRLVVDGRSILTADVVSSLPADPGAREVGLWTQGVGIDVRQVTVTPLPAS